MLLFENHSNRRAGTSEQEGQTVPPPGDAAQRLLLPLLFVTRDVQLQSTCLQDV